MRPIKIVGLFVCLYCPSLDAQQLPELDSPLEPKQVFLRMIEANASLSYSGSLAFERGGQLATYRVENQTEGLGNQSLISLNRVLPVQTHSFLCKSEEGAKGPDLDNLANLYNFYRPGDSVVAGREAIELLMLPVDANRYGYSFSVDAENYLSLRTVILSPQRAPIERYEFVNIEFHTTPQSDISIDCAEEEPIAAMWLASNIPDGFSLNRSSYNAESDVSELILSDSLATISISIEPVQAPQFPPVTTRLGATNILLSYLSFQQQIYLATLVGEVPIQSLEQIVMGLTPNQSQNGQIR